MVFQRFALLLSGVIGVPLLASAEVVEVLGVASQVQPSSDQVSVQGESTSAISVSIEPGNAGYPGVEIRPAESEAWDASAFSHVVATIRNTGKQSRAIHLRIDNPGDWRLGPWNVEKIQIEPGETKAVKTYFGFHNGFQKGYALDPGTISGMLVFTDKVSESAVSFQIESLVAAGKPGESPRPASQAEVSVEPKDGLLFVAGAEFAKQVRVTREETVTRYGPVQGTWDLRNYNQIAVAANGGKVELRAVDQGGRATDWMASPLTFTREVVWQGSMGEGSSEAGPVFDSRSVKAIEVRGGANVQEMGCGVHRFERPDWFGKRPPVAGDWSLTLEDEFDQPSIDSRTWNVAGPNYWGAKELTHWSRENVILNNGTAALRMEKKFGHHNDDPTQHTSDYTGGYLDTYDNWRQRYGYFEARVKLPTADGLWPAFWLMPDAGREAGPMWKRQKTEPRGMEFDILEHLTSWGPYRYHIAMHWDGYGKNHQSTGTSSIYFSPDEDGFVTTGLLWEPGRAVYYVNGREVGRVESERISDVPGMLIFTMPIGGWDNRPLDDAQLPAEFVIDYVRVWQRSDLASSVDGHYE